MLEELSEDAQHHAEQGNWGQYRNARYDTAEYMREEENWKRAACLYLEVLIFDLQGVAGMESTGGFHEAYSVASPAVVKKAAQLTLQHDVDKEKMKVIFDRVSDEMWIEPFPRSRNEVWTEMWEEIQAKRDAIRLTRKESTLEKGQLLSEEEAKAFIRCKNEYELIRRVESILEDEDPNGIPPKKEERAEMYLAVLNPESLEDRWRAKVYRRGGEIMLSRGGKKKALEYFERAHKSADQVELTEIDRIVEQLRPQVGE